MARNRRTAAQQSSTKRDATPRAVKSEEKRKKRSSQLAPDKLNVLVTEAIVDCHDREEQLMGLFNMIEENLALPFETSILGVPVVVKSVEERDDRIVAICARGNDRQGVSLLDLLLPSPPPPGSEWIEAYRHWSRF